MRVSTGQRVVLAWKDEKYKSSIGLPCFDCFARTDDKNVTLLTPDLIFDVSSCEISADLDGLVIAITGKSFSMSILLMGGILIDPGTQINMG